MSDSKGEDSMLGTLIFDRYRLTKKLGSGSFGNIYSATYEGQEYAIKLEDKILGDNLLENEAHLMRYLQCPGIPLVHSYGYSSKHYILVMELMGESLEDIFEKFLIKKMSVRCVCNIGYQMVEILEYIHSKHIIHRDIKPDNFVVGRNEKRKYIYLLDFGLSKKYRSSKTLKHYPMEKSKNLTGTARYASVNALFGYTQSRRDDLEGVGYVLMYLLLGKLPWQGLMLKSKEDRYKKIREKKAQTTVEELCQGFPRQFADYIRYTKNLEYEEDPNYHYLKNLFLSCLREQNFTLDCYYDWDKETITYSRDFKTVIKNNNQQNEQKSVSISSNRYVDNSQKNNFSINPQYNQSTNISTQVNIGQKDVGYQNIPVGFGKRENKECCCNIF